MPTIMAAFVFELDYFALFMLPFFFLQFLPERLQILQRCLVHIVRVSQRMGQALDGLTMLFDHHVPRGAGLFVVRTQHLAISLVLLGGVLPCTHACFFALHQSASMLFRLQNDGWSLSFVTTTYSFAILFTLSVFCYTKSERY